jgi:hypothetical protein
MIWALGLVVMLVALSIPILAITRYAPSRGAVPKPHAPPDRAVSDDLDRRIAALEDEVDELSRAYRELREETQFLQSLLEQPDQRSSFTPPKP